MWRYIELLWLVGNAVLLVYVRVRTSNHISIFVPPVGTKFAFGAVNTSASLFFLTPKPRPSPANKVHFFTLA